ncbi:carbamoyltransferase HypF [Campylobacter majalis]|uniref:carbamoyltransferase HypF n=1 Tax=Campylobacter majalis TaxID=2790656 RepID=UPI003D689E28
MKQGVRYEISGLVQGVGFRPFIYTLAKKFNLNGEVYNDDSGVKLKIWANQNDIKAFEKALFNELPPLARIDEIIKQDCDDKFNDFSIIESKSDKKFAPILPDFALCHECEQEYNDPNNTRYKYPFINCTNCGPRFSIIKALPYDRINTTMNKFNMCKTCHDEYTNPLDRRYHAQPISCPDCGPTMSLKTKNAEILSIKNDAIKQAAKLINDGKILAVKGLGGYHLICKATCEQTVSTLRERKQRPHKPFAIMCRDISQAKTIANINKHEEQLIKSNLKPIVLLQAKAQSQIAKNVAPNLDKLGIMLPFSGIHLALFEYLDCAIIATSANISAEPVIYDEISLKNHLNDVIDYYLDHDRDIYSPSDDSIAYVINDKHYFVRTSRGLHPYFIHTKYKKQATILALGAELKNQFAIYHNSLIMISPYIGDLKNVATFDRFKSVLKLFVDTYELKFDYAIADMHPYFLNTKYAQELGLNIIKAQHHQAHLLSVVFENNLSIEKEYVGFAFDGTGYGLDGNIWGGEILKIKGREVKRLYKFDEILLIGGENSIKNISQIALSVILKYDLIKEANWFLQNFDKIKLINLTKLHFAAKNCVKTSSIGRIFDAFAAVILRKYSISYEAQSGMELETLYDESLDVAYELEICNGIIGYKKAFINALKDEPKVAATAFINGLANVILAIAKEQKSEILLSGGVFLNQQLTKRLHFILKQNDIKYYENIKFGANDSNICIGQLQYALIGEEHER